MPKPRVLHDHYFKLAKEEGYLARSAYKLIEMNEKRRLIRSSDRVIDLGCAPGSWLQVAEQIIGPRGQAVGIDLQEVAPIFGPNVSTIVGDAFKADRELLLRFFGGAKADVLLSDMAPNTTGHGDDHMSARLCRRVLELVPHVLRVGGHLCMKVLEGSDMPDLIVETRAMFREAGTTKPDASREISREIFIWAWGRAPGAGLRKGPRAAGVAPPPPELGPGWGSSNTEQSPRR